jgi:hypothetical protein
MGVISCDICVMDTMICALLLILFLLNFIVLPTAQFRLRVNVATLLDWVYKKEIAEKTKSWAILVYVGLVFLTDT